MSEKPLIILASARKESDTKKFLNVVFANIDHTLMDLLDFPISPYDYSNHYPDDDGFPKIINEVLNHSTIVFATPVYWYSMSGLMKTFFDRFSDLVTIKKPIGRQLKDKSTFLLAVGADEKLPPGFEMPFKLTSDYLGMIFYETIYYSTKVPVERTIVQNSIKSFLNKMKLH